MKALFSLTVSLVLLLWVLWACTSECNAQSAGDKIHIGHSVSSGNLTMFFLTQQDTVTHGYLTLARALITHRAVIHENNSQTLWIENLSDSDLYLQSGDIIKGGQQDRMVASDLVLGPHETSNELNVFCVESGRSSKRGNEPLQTFSSSDEAAPMRHLRILARTKLTASLLTPHIGGYTAPDTTQVQLLQELRGLTEFSVLDDAVQESIWNDVTRIQSDLSRLVGDSVTRNASPTSLELALEHEKVLEREQAYRSALQDAPMSDAECNGVLYAIGGELRGAELYSNHALFLAMWPKVLGAISLEAMLAESNPAQDESNSPESKQRQPDELAAEHFLAMPDRGRSVTKQMNDRTVVLATESPSIDLFATRDTHFPTAWLHKEYLLK